MERREFLVGLGSLLVLASTGCSSSSTSTSADGFDVRSSVVNAHSHVVTVFNADLESPPAGGADYLSTDVSAHLHQISLSAAQLAAIQSGQTVTVTSTVEAAHQHTWTIRKP
jgi:hypothetical protein